MPRHTHLLAIDAQNDFCDLPPAACPPGQRPSLPVAGAHADLQRLAAWLRRHQGAVQAITTTLDSHQRFDIAHPGFWQQRGGAAVAPFTPITAAQVRAGDCAPRAAAHLAPALAYLDALEAQGRYTLMVWPVHCEVGSWGHGLHAELLAALGDWQLRHQQAVHAVFKGLNPWTEHYSALQAEVPDPADAATALNHGLLQRLDKSDCIVVAGEASSHCVRATVEHLVQHLPGGRPERLVLLTDCMSPVPGFEAAHQAFLDGMAVAGVRLAISTEFQP